MSKNDNKVLAYDSIAIDVIRLVIALAVVGIAFVLFYTGTIYEYVDIRRMDDDLLYAFAGVLGGLALLMFLPPVFGTASFQKKINKIGEDVLLDEINNKCLYEYKITKRRYYYFTQNYIICTDQFIWDVKDIKAIELILNNSYGLRLGFRKNKGGVYTTTLPIKECYQGVHDAVLQANPNVIDNVGPKLKK